VVVGASFDTVEEQKAFADEQGFTYSLLSDPDRVMGAAYEAVRPADDPLAVLPYRYSYLIAPDGTIAATYDLNSSQSLDEHADVVLADILSRS
jgi:peroxiredoxin Q/BCP